jgi:cytochrome c-type biogenesis protein CcmH
MKKICAMLMLLACCLLSDAAAALDPIDYQSPAEEQRFKALAAELRCVMCQNQSIADSNAPIAHDLRMEVLRLMREGRNDEEIKQYLVERYTDFVLYEPPMRGGNWLLWFGPFALLLVGGIAVAAVIRNKQKQTDTGADAGEEW